MPTFMLSIKDNKRLREKTTFCIKRYLKLMDVGYRHIPLNLTRTSYPKTIKINLVTIKNITFSF
ncbi:hypothetical protein COK55_06005 [Bacillus cereus]|nr:hypothetical protein COK55_06005 [Bacillus cereus]